MNRKHTTGSLADLLLRNKVVQPEALRGAQDEARNAGVAIERHLVDKNVVPQEEMTLAIAEYLGMSPISLAHFQPTSAVVEAIPPDFMKKHLVIPLAKMGKTLTVALGDPFNIVTIEELQTLNAGFDIVTVVASEKQVKDTLEKCFSQDSSGVGMNIEDVMKSSDDGDLQMGRKEDAEPQSLEDMMESAGEGPVIRMVNMILVESVRLQANDIHIEPQEDYVRLRYRVDGVLVERPNLPKTLHSAIVSRVKIMSDLDIGESRLPQDGRFRIKTLGKSIDVRVSILPSIFGGRVVMRTMDKSALFPNLAALGLDERAYNALMYAIAQPRGIILVTGPTGSGKTTTLYSCLQELNRINVNIVTCEDPVEYQIPGIIQVKINEEVGCTFASALRAILRQDPDTVLIGEIRDSETAEIAIKAALTGHLVLSTLHANDAAATVTRLLDIGMEPFLLASSVILTQSQRLFRKLCQVCKRPAERLDLELLKNESVDPAIFEGHTIYEPVGCPKCHNTGYKGRAAIMEVLPIDDDMRGLIIQQAVADEIRDKAEQKGMLSLRKVALQRVLAGETSLAVAFKLTSA